MNSFLFTLYRIIVPKPLRVIIRKRSLRRKIIDHFTSLPAEKVSEEQMELVEYLKVNPLTTFPYPFHKKYTPDGIDVFHDPVTRLPYVMQDGKKLYFKKYWTRNWIRNAFTYLTMEQDPESPHCYLSGSLQLDENDVVADLGPAEGNFSLSMIDRVKKIYLIEPDREWVETLEATFAPWKHKVEIIEMFISDKNDDKNIRLDSLLNLKKDITFLKVDIEGFEKKMLDGAEEFLDSRRPMKISLCTYHKPGDESEFTELLVKHGFRVTPSRGYMIPFTDKKLGKPWIRRGLIRAVRSSAF